MKRASLFLAAVLCSVAVFAQSETKMEAKGPHGAKMEKKTEKKANGKVKTSVERKDVEGHGKKMKAETKSAM